MNAIYQGNRVLKTSIGRFSVPYFVLPTFGTDTNVTFVFGQNMVEGSIFWSAYNAKVDLPISEFLDSTLSAVTGFSTSSVDIKRGSTTVVPGLCIAVGTYVEIPFLLKDISTGALYMGHIGNILPDYYFGDAIVTDSTVSAPSANKFGYVVANCDRSITVPVSTALVQQGDLGGGLPAGERPEYYARLEDEILIPTIDPYEEGGDSEPDEGGEGTFDDASDQIDDSTLPTISAANTGFTRIFNPTLAQVQSLANYLWTDPSILQTLWNQIKISLENPMDAFIAFNLVPCAIPDGGTQEFKLMFVSTGVQLTAAATQFIDVDCGDLAIDKYYDSALDYSPYTKISMFLPFIGTIQLDTDDVMGHTISVKYRIDIVSGGCVAKVFVDGSIHYQYSGHCAITIPFTASDFTGYISAMIQAAKAAGSIVAGAMGASEVAQALADMPMQKTSKSTTVTTSYGAGVRNAGRPKITEHETISGTEASFGSIVATNFNNTVGAVMGSKMIVERSGTFSGTTGYLGVRRPFVIIERPRMCNPAEYGRFNGRPAMMNMNLSHLRGYTQVQQIQLTGIPATNPEVDEIGSLLKSGVIL